MSSPSKVVLSVAALLAGGATGVTAHSSSAKALEVITSSRLVAPVLFLAFWTMLIQIWMFYLRIPALFKAAKDGKTYESHQPPSVRLEVLGSLPAEVRWKADNYVHLHEQPTVFYAVALAGAIMGQSTGLNVALAWGYVGFRIVHSLWQCLVNKIPVRFVLFASSSLCLLGLIVNLLRTVW
jgi:hypothetical protein